MKRILITGKDSYIGTSFEKWVSQWPEDYEVRTIDTVTNEWENMDFKEFDAILHVAAIVHKKEKNILKKNYMKVNCELPVMIAQKAKKEGVTQFVFVSSMSIYGKTEGKITDKTTPNPVTLYGKSKYEAEKRLECLKSLDFKVAIVRPPMVYGEKCKGNYRMLSSLAKKIRFFPDYENKRSMIYIDNLSEIFCFIIDTNSSNVFFPQNREYVCTKDLVKKISNIYDKKMYTFKSLNWLIKKIIKKNTLLKKVLGNLYYDIKISDYNNWEYNVLNFEKSIEKTEQKRT